MDPIFQFPQYLLKRDVTGQLDRRLGIAATILLAIVEGKQQSE